MQCLFTLLSFPFCGRGTSQPRSAFSLVPSAPSVFVSPSSDILPFAEEELPTVVVPPEEEQGRLLCWEDTREFIAPVHGGEVIKVYDADTITIATMLPFVPGTIMDDDKPFRFSIRLRGIDAPEMKGKNVSEEEKAMAILARDFVASKVLHKRVRLENVGNEKYNRVLADVYTEDGVHLNALLLQERWAVPYDGGTKQSPASWQRYHSHGVLE